MMLQGLLLGAMASRADESGESLQIGGEAVERREERVFRARPVLITQPPPDRSCHLLEQAPTQARLFQHKLESKRHTRRVESSQMQFLRLAVFLEERSHASVWIVGDTETEIEDFDKQIELFLVAACPPLPHFFREKLLIREEIL